MPKSFVLVFGLLALFLDIQYIGREDLEARIINSCE
jgi:hypothetical protein